MQEKIEVPKTTKYVPKVLSYPESITAFTYRHESADSPFKIPNIEWGIRDNYHITNTCALDSVLFCCYVMSQNQILRQRVFDEKIEAIFILMDQENFDDARIQVLSSGPSMWDSRDHYNRFLKQKRTDAWGALSQFFYFFQPSHLGYNWKYKCGSCNRKYAEHWTYDARELYKFPSDIKEFENAIKEKLGSHSIELCDLSVRGESVIFQEEEESKQHSSEGDESEYIKEALRESALKELSKNSDCCKGKMEVFKRLTHLPPFLLITQGSVNQHNCEELTGTRKKLYFTDIPAMSRIGNLDFFLHCVILSNGYHFKAAVRIEDEKWIAHDGMQGWAVGNHGDSNFGKWFQMAPFQIVQVMYEIQPDVSQASMEQLEVPVAQCAKNIATIARRTNVEMSNQYWKFVAREEIGYVKNGRDGNLRSYSEHSC